jgi:hypothetical protein
MSERMISFRSSRANSKVTKPLTDVTILAFEDIENRINQMSERLLKTEALVKIQPTQEPEKQEVKEPEVKEPEPPIVEPEQEAPDIQSPLITELENRLRTSEVQSHTLDSTILDLDKDDDDDDNMTVATEEGLQLISETPELQQCGLWTVDEMCHGCQKTGVKNYQKRKKQAEKDAKNERKEVIGKQKKLIEAEQLLLKKKLKDLKKGRTLDYSNEESRQNAMRDELKKMCSKGGGSSASFNINMYV